MGRYAIETRLSRAGLTEEQVQATLDEHAADLDGLEKWIETVHDNDIKERFGDGSQVEAAGEVDDGGSDDGIRES